MVISGGPDGQQPDGYHQPLLLLPQTRREDALHIIEYHFSGSDVKS